jgi:multisubunit Na+/H+ antiporter MnhE subunit
LAAHAEGYAVIVMRNGLRPWIAWWLALALLYLLLDDSLKLPELAVGAIAAAVGATGATLVARHSPAARPQGRWLIAALRPLLGVFGDLAALASVLVRRGILRHDDAGVLVEVPFRATSDELDDVAYRAWTETLGSLAPNTVVVDVDKTRGILLAHQLHATSDAPARAAPLP